MLREERTMNFKNQLEQWKKPGDPKLPSHVVHAMFMGRTVYLPTFTMNHVNVGKYTSPMDPIGGDYFIKPLQGSGSWNHQRGSIEAIKWSWEEKIKLKHLGRRGSKDSSLPPKIVKHWNSSQEGTVPYPLPRAVGKIHCPFPKVRYVSPLEGSLSK